MRVIWRLFLAPVILAAATMIATGSAHQADPAALSASPLAAHACPAGSNWDNTIHRCV